MAVTSRAGTKWKDRETSPERTKVWTEPQKHKTDRKVQVVYYLSRNGKLEHPHFMEVSLSSSDGLYLRDVINRLNLLRGKGMAAMYSWSSKRSYKSGFVWHDLADNDFIYPSHGQEYVLKGSELLNLPPLASTYQETTSSSSVESQKPPEDQKSGLDPDFPSVSRRRNQSWSAVDLHEYKVYKAESVCDYNRKSAADASTQTDDKRRRRRSTVSENEENHEVPFQNPTTELNREDISPPPSDSSPETLESLMKADGRLTICSGTSTVEPVGRTANINVSGRMKASSVLMQLISCGSVSFRECGQTAVKDHGLSLISESKPKLLRGAGNQGRTVMELRNLEGVKMEDKEYFSGSLIDTKKEEVPALKRSSSYNADRSSQLQSEEKEIKGERTRCIPMKPKAQSLKKDNNISCEVVGCSSNSNSGRISNRKVEL